MELQFMKIIWAHPDGAATEAIHSAFSQARGTKTATLTHMIDKGYVDLEKRGGKYYYLPTVSRLEYDRAVLTQKLHKSFGTSSIFDLVSMYCGRDALSQSEQEEACKLFEKFVRTPEA